MKRKLWPVIVLASAMAINAACGGDSVITISITSPRASTKPLNAAADVSPKDIAGFQIHVEVSSNLPDGTTITLKNTHATGSNTAEVGATGGKAEFKNFTLGEGQNTLQASAVDADGASHRSDSVVITIDTVGYKVVIKDPLAGAVLGKDQDENESLPGLQKTVVVNVDAAATEEVELTIAGESGSPVKSTQVPSAGTATFQQQNFPEGEVTLTASIKDAAGNVTQDEVKLKVKSMAPTVRITAPAEGKTCCGGDDADPATPGLQVDVKVETNAGDKSSVVLVINGKKGATAPTAQVLGGKAVFSKQTLPDGDVTLVAEVTDEVKNTGTSPEVKITVDSKPPELTFLGLKAAYTSSDDLDKTAPGLQMDVVVIAGLADGDSISLDLNGTVTKKVVASGRAVFSKVTLKKGKNTLQASAEDDCRNMGRTDKKEIVWTEDPVISCTLTKGGTFAADGSVVVGPLEDTLPGNTCPAGNTVCKDQSECTAAEKCVGGKCAKVCTSDSDCGTGELCATGFHTSLACDVANVEDGDSITLTISGGSPQTEKVAKGKVTFADFKLATGANQLKVKAVNAQQKTGEKSYEVYVDDAAPDPVTGLQVAELNHREASVSLTWTVPKDVGVEGKPKEFQLWWSWKGPVTNDIWDADGKVKADWAKMVGTRSVLVTKKVGETEKATVGQLKIGKAFAKYWFAVRAVDSAGNMGKLADKTCQTDAECGTGNVCAPAKVCVAGPYEMEFKRASTTLAGTKGGDFGAAMAVLGDVDKDGAVDLAVCEERADSNKGKLHLYFGSKSDTPLKSAPDVTISGEAAAHFFCKSVTAMGDLNGDGFGDFAVGAMGVNSLAGRVYIFFGGARSKFQGLTPQSAEVIIDGNAASMFGAAITGAGALAGPDINGDQRPDLVVGAFREANGGSLRGSVYVFYGRKTYPTGTPALKLTTKDADVVIKNDTVESGIFGAAVAVGDFDGDKRSDIAAGAYGHTSYQGAVYVFYGSTLTSSMTLANAGVTISGEAGTGRFGLSIAGVGDVNRDGKDDLVVGAPKYPVTAGHLHGAVYLFSGNGLSSTTADKATLRWVGEGQHDQLGSSISSGGDLNKDGYADLVFGAKRKPVGGKPGVGVVYAILGGRFSELGKGQIGQAADFMWAGAGEDLSFGSAVFGGFDLTGDGYDDVVITETSSRNLSSAAGVFVVR